MLPRVTETKRFADGRVQTFECEALALSPERCVLRYVSDREFHMWGVTFPVGTVTYAFYWHDRTHTLWRMIGPDGALIGHKFDVCDEVKIEAEGVSWRDLLLDVWVEAAGRATLLDADELERAYAAGSLSEADVRRTRATGECLMREHPKLVAEAVRELASLGVDVGQ